MFVAGMNLISGGIWLIFLLLLPKLLVQLLMWVLQCLIGNDNSNKDEVLNLCPFSCFFSIFRYFGLLVLILFYEFCVIVICDLLSYITLIVLPPNYFLWVNEWWDYFKSIFIMSFYIWLHIALWFFFEKCYCLGKNQCVQHIINCYLLERWMLEFMRLGERGKGQGKVIGIGRRVEYRCFVGGTYT